MIRKLLVVCFILIVFVTGCGEKSNEGTVMKTCVREEEGYTQTYKFTGTNDELKKVGLVINYDSSIFGEDDFSKLTEDQKEEIKLKVLTNLGLEEKEYKGFDINIDMGEQVIITIDANLEEADKKVLRKIGLDFSDMDLTFEEIINLWTENGVSCK